MPIRELREIYGNGKAHQVINRAVRAEIEGGEAALNALAAAIDLLAVADKYRLPWRDDAAAAVTSLNAVAKSMRDEIARRYGLTGSNPR